MKHRKPKHRRPVPAEHYVDPVFDPRPQAEHQWGKWCPVCTPDEYAAHAARHRLPALA